MSRAIDALIAEHVMGWTDKITFVDGRPSIWPSGKLGPISVPHYSTDIKAAWEVYERINIVNKNRHGVCDNLVLGLNPYQGSDKKNRTYCVMMYINYDCLEIYSEAPTQEMAICLAALKSKNIEVPSE